MRYFTLAGLALSAIFCFGGEVPASNYHGVVVEDPFRYLEDTHSLETQEWIEAQNSRTSYYLSQIPQRDSIRQRLDQLAGYERYGVFFETGGKYFFFKNDGLQNQSVLYTMDSLDSTPELLIDPNLFSADGTSSLNFCRPSDDARWIAYTISHAGSDWNEIRVRDVQTKEDLSDVVQWVKFSYIAWRGDGSGFYYSRYDAPESEKKYSQANLGHKIYFHRLGTSQEEDTLTYERADHPDWLLSADLSGDSRYLVISAHSGCEINNAVFYQDLWENGPIVELFTKMDAQYIYLGNNGTRSWFLTSKDAPCRRIISLDLQNPEEWTEIIPEQKEPITYASMTANRLIVRYLKDAYSRVDLFDQEGGFEKTLFLPSLGNVYGFDPGPVSDTETFYIFTSYTQPATVYRYDFDAGESQVVFAPSFPISCEDFETRQVFYTSKDGTVVPMLLSHKKGVVWDGSNPTILYGYGGFGIPITPSFSIVNMTWMEMGGVYAVANIRGGGEYGLEWHEAGRLKNKQNGFDDFIAAAQWLVANQITSSSKLAIHGASNGGLLVGACLTQRPDLFGAAIPSVGVLDMLRFDKFTIGWAWKTEYGSPDNPEDFACLYKYSPLHNVRSGVSYPPTLVTTADHDDRVVPIHSYKFTAALQKAQGSNSPVFLRVETSAGHGAGTSLSKFLDESADKLSFLMQNLVPEKK